MTSHFENIILFQEKKHKVKVTMNLDILRSQGHRRAGASLRVGMMFYLSEGEEWEESYFSMLYQIKMRQCGIICQNLLVMNTSCHWPKYIKPHVQVIHPNEMRLIMKK